jgi:tetratricopeptide (TPR) repeat protein
MKGHEIRIPKSLFVLLLFSSSVFGADIEGEVRTGARTGLQRAAFVQLLDGAIVVKETFTGLDGRFEFSGVPAKPYTIRVVYSGFSEHNVPVNPGNGNARTRVPITLKPAAAEALLSAEVVASDELNVPRAASREYEEGLQLRRKGDCAKALPHLQKAVSLYDRFGNAYDELGNCARQQGRLAEAETHFRKAIQHTSSISPSINLTNLLLSSKRFDDALEVIRAAIRFNPTDGDLFFALARVYSDQGKMREAEAAGLESHSRGHRLADVHLLLARIYLEARNYPALVTQLETYLIENPTGPAAAQARATLAQMRSEAANSKE